MQPRLRTILACLAALLWIEPAAMATERAEYDVYEIRFPGKRAPDLVKLKRALSSHVLAQGRYYQGNEVGHAVFVSVPRQSGSTRDVTRILSGLEVKQVESLPVGLQVKLAGKWQLPIRVELPLSAFHLDRDFSPKKPITPLFVALQDWTAFDRYNNAFRTKAKVTVAGSQTNGWGPGGYPRLRIGRTFWQWLKR